MKRLLVTSLLVVGLAVGMILVPAAALAAFGIDPGKVYIDNLYPGAEAEFPITVYNQNDYETVFKVIPREPDYTAEDKGYDALPYPEWVTVSPERVTIGASDTNDIIVTVVMPEGADYSGKKSEVWISFMEEGTEGMVKIELCSRIFISTRVEEPAEVEPEPEAPTTTGGGAVGITAEAGEPETVSPETAETGFNWIFLGSALGVILGGGVGAFLIKRRHRV
ncbi:hypothetical protein ES708_07416 [subsurface metagenome]